MHRAFSNFLFFLIFAYAGLAGGPASAAALNIVGLLPDSARPRLYAVNNKGKTATGSILVIDTLTHATIKEIPVGKEPTDIDLTENSAELVVMNTTDRSISRINLTTLVVTATYQLSDFNTNNEDFGGHVVDGPGNIIYYVDEQWGPRLRVYDTSTGTVLQTFGATSVGTGNDYGFGDIVVNPGKTALFGWVQYGDGAGWAGSFAVRYNIAGNGMLTLGDSGNSDYPTLLTREPYDSKALMTADGSQLVIKNRGVNQADMDHFPVSYADNIYSMSSNGKIVASSTKIYPGAGGEILYSLPVTATVQAILPDYSAMVYFNPTTQALVWLDLVTTLGTKALGLDIAPADGATVVQPKDLRWIPVTGILRYQIYLGTNRGEVELATAASASYLGEAVGTSFNLTTPMVSGQTYFWRVVPVGTDGLAGGAGITRSFRVSNLSLSRSSIAAETVEGVSRHVETISLQAASAQSWSVTANVPWITFENSSGSTPGNISAVFNASALKAGSYVGNITLTTGGVPISIPVSMKLYPANYVISEADLELPWVYVISQESNTSSQPSFLLRINTATNQIESDVACGRSVTDLAIHYQENRIYLTNWQTGILRAFDRSTFSQVQTYQFAPVGPIGYGEGGLWRVAAGKKGRLILEEADQWIDIRLIDTAKGTVVAANSNSEYAGDGEADPTGRYYYHSGLNTITRYDLIAEGFTKLSPAPASQGSSVVMIGDGSKVACGNGVFNAQLDLEFSLPAEVRTGTLHGDLLFTNAKAYNGRNGLELATLPIATSVMSVTGDQKKLYLFPASSKTFQTVDLSTIATLPPREVTPAIADGSTVIGTNQTLGWSIEPFASSYRIYFGTSRDAVANATEASAEYLGSSVTNGWSGALPPLALDGKYFWRVDVIGFSGTRTGAIWSFDVAPLSINPVKLDLVLPTGAPLTNRTLVISGPAGNGWTASTSTPWLSVASPSGTTPGSLVVGANVAGMAAGIYQGSVRFTSGADTWDLPVSLELLALNYTLAEADLEAPYIYAISQAASGTDDRAFMVVIDTLTNAITRVVPVGRSATDLAIHYQENRIYVSNWQTGKLLALDRTTFKDVKSYSYGAAGGYGTSSGDVYKVAAGKAGRLVIEQEDQWVNFFLIDTTTGNKLATGYAGEGGGVFDPSGRYYYHGENDSSGAEIQKYDTASNSFTEMAAKRVSGFNYYGSRRVLTSGDGSSVFWNGGVFDPDLNVRLQLTNEVVSSTYHGELIFTDKAAINGVNGENLATLPVTTSIQGVSADQTKLFLFKAGAFSVVDIRTIGKVSPRGLIPGIADGSTVIGTAQELSWSLEAAALSYNVYFGTSAAAVSSATKTSPEFLGNTNGTRWTGPLPALGFGGNYWWRVDIVGFNSTVVGSIWSFRIPMIDVVPRSIDLAYPAASPIPVQRLALTSHASGGSPMAWTATTATPWISLRSSSGTAPGNLDFDLNTIGLTIGQKEGSITIQAGGDTITVPVKLRIIPLNVTKLVAHPMRPVVYGINTAAAGEGFSHLLEIDAATAVILRSMPIGFSPTDADLDPANDRLYVSNWGYALTRVIDLKSWIELPSLSLGTDVYKLEVTARGRIVTEEQDQWIDVGLWNASTGENLKTTTSVREGDGETDPTGKFYYHCDNNSSGAVITKYDISGDAFQSVATGPQIGYGSRNLILSADGSKLFWLGRVLSADLKLTAQMPAEVYATSRAGDLAIGDSQIWWSDSGIPVATLPFASTVATISANDSHLVRFNATAKTLHSAALANLTDLPGPFPRPGQVVDVSPVRLTWSPVAGATSYRVFIGPDATALSAMSSPVAIVSTSYYDLPSPLAFGQFYSWRVDAVTAAAVVSGKVQSFGIGFPAGPVLPPLAANSQGVSASISDRNLLVGGNGTAQLYGFDPTKGIATSIQSFTLPGYYGDHYFGASVAVDAGKASVGAYALDTPADGGGAAFVYRSGESGYWQSEGPLSPPTPVAGEGFSRGLAASGNQMLAGTASSYNRTGRVAAYITEPTTVRVQTFSASDGVINDGFGQAIAMEGNQAIISAPGRGASYNRLPALYAFSRSTTTGLWTQTQKISIPGSNTYSNAGTVVALSGKYFATNNAAAGTVEIYVKNDSGQWAFSKTINRSAIPGSSSYYFGNGLALSGDQLFIGDAGATSVGNSGGAVFSFRRSGSSWIAGPVITPASGVYSGFGGALAARDGWLLATGGTSQAGWLFRVDGAANRTPRFLDRIPSQVVAGRPFSAEIHADDADGNQGLVFDLLQGPDWLKLANGPDGTASLSGVPVGNAGSVMTVQIRVRDGAGAQALHTYQLSLLTSTSLPVLTIEPAGGDTGEGQEVTLRAAASGEGPFVWQWYLNGKPVIGATGSTLVFSEISLADAGEYVVRVSNVVGQDESPGVSLAVHAANRFAGDWPTFGGGTRHAGYHPARLGKHYFVPAWSSSISPGRPLNRAATGDGKVFVTPRIYFGGSFNATAVDIESGATVWKHPFTEAYSLNPPTYHNGRVYIQRGNHSSDTQLWALDSGSGVTAWSSPHGAQWENYESPTVTDAGIWVNGGGYGGMYGFSPTGTQTFFRGLEQYDDWTPTVSNGRLYSWVAGLFQEHNPADGATLWSVNTGWNWSGWSMNTVSAISGDSAVVISTTEIICIDLPSRSIRWRKTGAFQGSPAISDARVYGIQGNKVVSYSLITGEEAPAITVPETISSGQPLLIMDYLFVASPLNTYVINRATAAVVQTLPGGGLLSFARAHLFAAGTDGILRAWYAGKSLEFASDPPPVIANERADDSQLDLAAIVSDPDGDGFLKWGIISNSNPVIFSSIRVDESGILRISYSPYVSGSSSVTVEVRNNSGATARTIIEVMLPELPPPLVKVNPSIKLNRSSGLYEQKVTVKNVAGRAIAGFELQVSGLRTGVTFYNATWAKKGGGTFVSNQPLAAGKTVTVILKYYSKKRGVLPTPLVGNKINAPAVLAKKPVKLVKPAVVVTSAPALAPAVAITLPSIPFAVTRCERLQDGTVVIEFPAESGFSYRMEYSEDATHWKQCSETLTTTGTSIQWLDRGPPSTDSLPASESRRFYRVGRITR
ncbi:MAG: hypothetical protein V4584_05325 [Verrucomicrobiota bacterium]